MQTYTSCHSTPQGDVIYLHEPLLWTLRQHATNGVSGPDSLARAIGAVAPPLLEITARVGEFGGDVICFHLMAGRLAKSWCLSVRSRNNWPWNDSCPYTAMYLVYRNPFCLVLL